LDSNIWNLKSNFSPKLPHFIHPSQMVDLVGEIRLQEMENKARFIHVVLLWHFKEKPRGGRSGGILFDPRGTQEITYACGLGVASNNVAKDYTLLRGLLWTRSLSTLC
jgi:hypothetical protein